ncbi:MAG: potassium-transporting ATPase subunit F [Cyanobacteria bacterium CRU_2_1]|nr:potassium-transporting ATPase subunit F [Cyanobacteria bacterium CRU_2_1]
MKQDNPRSTVSALAENLAVLWSESQKRKVPRYLFWALCLNLLLAPAVQAATDNALSRTQAYALGVLGIIMVALSGYLFTVMFQPEKF